MKKIACAIFVLFLFVVPAVNSEETEASTQDVYELVLKAYEVVKSLGEESFTAFNDPKGEFVYKNTYAYVQECPGEMRAHPFALEKLKGVDLSKTYEFNDRLCAAASKEGGGWTEYSWPKPGESEPSRKVAYGIKVEGTPYFVFAGIYSDSANIEDLNKTLR